MREEDFQERKIAVYQVSHPLAPSNHISCRDATRNTSRLSCCTEEITAATSLVSSGELAIAYGSASCASQPTELAVIGKWSSQQVTMVASQCQRLLDLGHGVAAGCLFLRLLPNNHFHIGHEQINNSRSSSLLTAIQQLAPMGQQYLFWFAQVHDDFRIPELQSVAEIHGFDLHIPQDLDASRPFCILELDHEEHARLLARRCILIRFESVIISVSTCIAYTGIGQYVSFMRGVLRTRSSTSEFASNGHDGHATSKTHRSNSS